MKLLYFTIQINMTGGLGRIVIDKINWLADHGYDVTLCNIERLDVKPAYPVDERVKLVRGDISTEPGNAFTSLKGVLKAIGRVKEIIAQENPDIIVNAHCPLVTWILPFVAKKTPKIVEIHQSRQGLDVFDRRYLGAFSRWLHRWSVRWIYSLYDKFVVLTNGDKNAWHNRNTVVIPNFTNYSELKENTLSCLDDKQILLIARIVPQKRIDLMIRVWEKLHKKYPDWKVKVLGGGEYGSSYEKKMREMIAERGMENSFLMPGAVPDVEEELLKSSILCLTSEYEGFGIVLIEAMLKGVPVMAFRYVGVDDIIEDGADGCIVPFGDVDAFAVKLSALMESKEKRKRLRDNALTNVKKFDKQSVMHQWEKLFESVLASA